MSGKTRFRLRIIHLTKVAAGHRAERRRLLRSIAQVIIGALVHGVDQHMHVSDRAGSNKKLEQNDGLTISHAAPDPNVSRSA